MKPHVTLLHMPDLKMCDFHVKGDQRYVVHFLKPDVFGQEFATILEGNKLFTIANGQQTECYLFDDTQLRNLVRGVESAHCERIMATATRAVKPSPCTGPIIIPPTRSDK